MSAVLRRGFGRCAVIGGLTAWLFLAAAQAKEPARAIELGRELFAREWVEGDTRSRSGDGLGPIFNDRSCLACHHQGGPGGGGDVDRNIEIATAVGNGLDSLNTGGYFYSFRMDLGENGFQYQIGSPNNTAGTRRQTPAPLDVTALLAIHPGFRDTRSVVVHRYGPDPDYRTWRERIPGPHGAIFVQPSRRNPTPLFGVGLIDAIPDEVLETAARKRFPGSSAIRGRVNRLPDGRIGRFGWKAQTPTLRAFVLSAAANEVGLEVPGQHQAADPRVAPLAAPGLDLDQEDCDALLAYVANLPAPRVLDPVGPKEELQSKTGATLFKSIGCAHCHVPALGDVEGIYSDLLLHEMSPTLGDTGSYGVFAARAEVEAPRPGKPGRRGESGPKLSEWRTPPLWGLRDSAPYLHDGRALSLADAITLHGGQGAASAQRYAQLSDRERLQLEKFLLSLAAPDQGPAGLLGQARAGGGR